jgi:hypothetical protein
VTEHVIEITVKQVTDWSKYYRAVCSCGEYHSRPCGLERVAVRFGAAHVARETERTA